MLKLTVKEVADRWTAVYAGEGEAALWLCAAQRPRPDAARVLARHDWRSQSIADPDETTHNTASLLHALELGVEAAARWIAVELPYNAHLEALVRAALRAAFIASVPGVRSDTEAKNADLSKLTPDGIYGLVKETWERRDEIIANLREQLDARATELDRLRASVTVASLAPCPFCGQAPTLQAPEEREGMFYYACESRTPMPHKATGDVGETPEAAAKAWNTGVGGKP